MQSWGRALKDPENSFPRLWLLSCHARFSLSFGVGRSAQSWDLWDVVHADAIASVGIIWYIYIYIYTIIYSVYIYTGTYIYMYIYILCRVVMGFLAAVFVQLRMLYNNQYVTVFFFSMMALALLPGRSAWCLNSPSCVFSYCYPRSLWGWFNKPPNTQF